MKREKTLRQGLIVFLILALILPMLCFAIISQIRIWRVVNDNTRENIENDIKGMNTTLDLILDKYAAMLYDFSTDDRILFLVDTINNKQDVLGTRSRELRRELDQLCNRHKGVEGITLMTDSGQIFFYDRMRASSHTSSWADRVAAPIFSNDIIYRDAGEIIHTAEGDSCLYQICQRLVNSEDINRPIGTVILSINTETLNQVFSAEEGSEAFICENGRILASTDAASVQKDISVAEKGIKMSSHTVNEKSGWSIYDYHSSDTYIQAFLGQTIAWGGMTVFMVVVSTGFVWYITNPVLDKVKGLVQAMNRVEAGDFSVRIPSAGRIPREIRRIVDGFNRMVQQLEKLIIQVTQSAIEQKNAEISAMEAQIDPHFLYNTLDTINWKAIEKEEYEISNMVGILADILRYSIRNPGETVSVGQVLYWMEQYSILQSKKLDAPLVVEVDVPEEIKNYRVHKLLLQPFVENSIRHGFWKKKEECRLKVSMRKMDGQIHIIVQDNGKGIAPEVLARLNDEPTDMSGHVGIYNVRTRLKLYYGDNATVYFESKEGCYTRAHIFVEVLCDKEEDCENSNCGG